MIWYRDAMLFVLVFLDYFKVPSCKLSVQTETELQEVRYDVAIVFYDVIFNYCGLDWLKKKFDHPFGDMCSVLLLPYIYDEI